VIQSIHEIEIIKNYLVKEKLTEEDSIGVAGTSMGAIVTFGALKRYPWIRAAASLMGCPSYQEFAKWQLGKIADMGIDFPLSESEIAAYFRKLAEYDLSTDMEGMNERPLLCWHGIKDQEVPIDSVLGFVKNLKGYYKNKPDNLKLIVDEKADHKVSREGVLATVDWFATHIGSPVNS
jgi:fermentation-respiration switch protein FrsA (DUF1100 family)